MLLLPFKFYNITFNEFLYEFFLILENLLKFANFFAEVTNSQSMLKTLKNLSNRNAETLFVCGTPTPTLGLV